MNGYRKFFGEQAKLGLDYEDFIRTLHPNRTVPLLGILDGSMTEKAAQLFPWLDVPRFVSRITSTCHFLENLPWHPRWRGWMNIPYFFLQASDAEEDQREFERRMTARGYEAFQMHHKDLPYESCYCPTETNLTGDFVGPDGGKVIYPLCATFSANSLIFARRWMEKRADKPRIIGLRIPRHYPEAFYVTPLTATDWITRTITHDIGHFFLPETDDRREGIHNVTMIHSMGVEPVPHTSHRFSDITRHEAVDPFFFLYAPKVISKCRELFRRPLEPIQDYVLKRFEHFYTRPNREERLNRVWKLNLPDTDFYQCCRAVRLRIEEFARDGFAVYDPKLVPLTA